MFQPSMDTGTPRGEKGLLCVIVDPKEGKAQRLHSKKCVCVYRYLYALPPVAKRGRQSPSTEDENADACHVGAENQSHLL